MEHALAAAQSRRPINACTSLASVLEMALKSYCSCCASDLLASEASPSLLEALKTRGEYLIPLFM